MLSQGLRFAAILGFLFAIQSLHVGASIPAIATFNDYATQSNTACGAKPINEQAPGVWSAALGDLSPLWQGAKCAGSLDAKKCDGKGWCTSGNCNGPSCPRMGNCGQCFNVRCVGPLNAQSGQGACTNQVVKVMIVDACPSSHPENYCKTSPFGGKIVSEGCCAAYGKNAFDLASPTKNMLSTYAGGLLLDVTPVAC